MNDARDTALAPRQLTVEDLKQKALHVRDIAESEARATLTQDTTRVLIVGAVAVVAIVSLAYYLGTRRGWDAVNDLA